MASRARSAKVESGFASDRALSYESAHDLITKPLTLWWIMREGPAMLIRSEIVGVRGGMADAVRSPAMAPASLRTLIIGGILLLIGP
jgi:hypothetical protein